MKILSREYFVNRIFCQQNILGFIVEDVFIIEEVFIVAEGFDNLSG